MDEERVCDVLNDLDKIKKLANSAYAKLLRMEADEISSYYFEGNDNVNGAEQAMICIKQIFDTVNCASDPLNKILNET